MSACDVSPRNAIGRISDDVDVFEVRVATVAALHHLEILTSLEQFLLLEHVKRRRPESAELVAAECGLIEISPNPEGKHANSRWRFPTAGDIL